jgi:hypothetical protein
MENAVKQTPYFGEAAQVLAGTLAWATKFLGGLSFFVLVARSLELGIAEPLRVIVEEYDSWVRALGDFLKPSIEIVLDLVNRSLAVELHLVKSWHHVLVAFSAVIVTYFAATSIELAKHWSIRWFERCVIAWLIGCTLYATTAPKGASRLTSTTPLTDLVPILIAGLFVYMGLLQFWFASMRGPEFLKREARLVGWVYLSLPLIVVFMLVTNAGFQLASHAQ